MTEGNGASAPPALWRHVQNMYGAMSFKSEERNIDNKDVVVCEGFVSRISTDAKIPVPYYGKVMEILKQMGCISQLRRGGGPSPSLWALWKEPDLDDFTKVVSDFRPIGKEDGRIGVLEGQLADVRENLGGINIPQALADLQIQINQLKEKVP